MEHPTREVVLPHVQDRKSKFPFLLCDLRNYPVMPEGQLGFARRKYLTILVFDAERKDARFLIVMLEERTDCIVRNRFRPIHHGWFHEPLIDIPAIGILGNVALSCFKSFQEPGFEVFSQDLSGKLQCARGVLHDLHTLQP